MSIVYSHLTGKYIDLDSMEAFELSNGDYIPMHDDCAFWDAYDQGLISDDDMMLCGFTEEDLKEHKEESN
jgi:hypothetical protein